MGEQETKRHVSNGLGHFDIAGRDLEMLRGFYTAVLGWKVHVQGPGYALVQTPDGSPDGALVESDVPGVTIGVVVPELGRALELAGRNGGRVVMPATDNGWVTKAQVADPAGNIVTLIQE